MSASRDLALLTGAGLLVAWALLAVAREAAVVVPSQPTGQCIEQWDPQHEWQPHVDCSMPFRATRRNK